MIRIWGTCIPNLSAKAMIQHDTQDLIRQRFHVLPHTLVLEVENESGSRVDTLVLEPLEGEVERGQAGCVGRADVAQRSVRFVVELCLRGGEVRVLELLEQVPGWGRGPGGGTVYQLRDGVLGRKLLRLQITVRLNMYSRIHNSTYK